MTTKEMIAVMQAYDEGKQIQQRLINNSTWADCPSPKWKWDASEYRIKPELPKPKLRPYANAEEFIEAQQEHGPYFTFGGPSYFPVIVSNWFIAFVLDMFIDHECNRFDYRVQFEKYENLISFCWQDGTPCGITEDE